MRQKADVKKRYQCGFKAPDLAHKQAWDLFVADVKDDGLDVCRVAVGFAQAYSQARRGLKEAIILKAGYDKVIVIEQHNVFNYMVEKPRRIPHSVDCVKPQFQNTIRSSLFDSYVENKARRLGGEFTFRDFLELKYDSFRRIIVRLKRKGVIIAHPLRSIPRVYILAETLSQEQKEIAASRVQ